MKNKTLAIFFIIFICFVLAINTTALGYNTQEFLEEEHFSIINEKCQVMTDMPLKTEEIYRKMDPDPKPTMSFDDLPNQFSWTDYNGNWLTPVKNQGSCGSCYIFGTWGAFEAAINIASGYPNTNIDLSEQYGLSCINGGNNGCSGGWGSTMLTNVASSQSGQYGNGINGVTIESCMPYTATDYLPCSSKCGDWDYHNDPPEPNDKLWQISGYGWFTTQEKNPYDWDIIKTFLKTKGPLAVSIAWDSGLQYFANTHHNYYDVYETDSSDFTNHQLVLCGWVDDSSILNGGYWILKNSYGTNSGYGGYINVAYGCNQVGCSETDWVIAEEWPEDQQGPGPGYPEMHVFADFSYDPDYPKLGTTIEFDDTSHGNVVLREWDLNGDGIIDSTAKKPENTYYEEGVYNVTLIVWSSAGLNSTMTRFVEVKEIWPPIPIASPKYYGDDDFSITFEGRYSYDVDGVINSYHWDFDDGSTSDESHVTHVFSQGDQIYNVALTVTDNDGAESTTYCDIRIDITIPPETMIYVFGYEDLGQWFKTDVKINLIAYDWSGIDDTFYMINDGEYQIYTEPFTISDEGQYTINFYSVDVHGNQENVKSQTIKIDKTPPTLDIEILGDKENDWYTNPVDVTLSGFDHLSGLDMIIYKMDQGSWETYDGFMTLSDGEHRLWAYSIDKAGNNYGSDAPLIINVDTGAPVSHVFLDGNGSDNIFYKTVNVALSASDQGSGVEKIYYSIDGGGFEVYSTSFEINELGDHSISFYAVDNIGNREETQSIVFTVSGINFNMELAKPTNGLYLMGNRIFKIGSTIILGSINIEVEISSFTSDPSDVQYVEFFIDGTSKMTDSTAPYGWILSEQMFGTHEIKVTAHSGDGSSITKTIDAMIFIL